MRSVRAVILLFLQNLLVFQFPFRERLKACLELRDFSEEERLLLI